MNKDPKMVAMHFFVADWISGTRGLTCQQRGIYFDLLAFSQTFNGKGLPENLNELCKLVLHVEFDQEKLNELRQDLIFVINTKFKNIDGRFYNERQHSEFIKSKELSKARSQSRTKAKEKKVDVLLLEQNSETVYKDKDKSEYIDIFNNIWNSLEVRKGSKQKSFEKWLKIKDVVSDAIIIDKYNQLCKTTDDPQFIPYFITWLNQSRWNDEVVFNPKQFASQHNIKGQYLSSDGNYHTYETKESWGFVKWTYDQDGNLMKEKDINAKKEEKEQEKTVG